MTPTSRLATIRPIGIFIVTLLTLAFLGPCQAQAKKGPAEVSVENGQTVLTLDTPTRNRLGLEVATLTTLTRAQITSPAVVLSVQDLATFRNGYVATQAQLQKSRVEAEESLSRLQGRREQMARFAVTAGESDPLPLIDVQLQGTAAAQAKLRALVRAQIALGNLEHAVQRRFRVKSLYRNHFKFLPPRRG